MTTADVADKPLGRRIEPPDDSRRVEDVARDEDVLQALDITADLQATGHRGSVTDPGGSVPRPLAHRCEWPAGLEHPCK